MMMMILALLTPIYKFGTPCYFARLLFRSWNMVGMDSYEPEKWTWQLLLNLRGFFDPFFGVGRSPSFFSIYISGTTVFINVRSIITNAWDRITYAEEPKTLSSSPIFQSFPRMFTAKNRHLTVDLQGLEPTRPHTWSRELYSIFLSVINFTNI